MNKLSMSLSEIPKNAKLAIYGTGKRGNDYFKILSVRRPDVVIVCFLDSFRADHTAVPPIHKLSNVNFCNLQVEIILICSYLFSEIEVNLKKFGIIGNNSVSVYIADWSFDKLSSEELVKCEEIFHELLNTLINESFVYDALANIECLKNNFKSALPYYKKALDISPDDISLHLGYAKTLGEANRCDESIETYKLIIAKFPDSPSGYLEYARALVDTTRYKESIAMYKLIIAKFPDNLSGYLGYANATHGMDQYDESEYTYMTTLKRFPDSIDSYIDYATFLIYIGRCNDAEELLLSTKKTLTDDRRYLEVLKRAYIAKGEYRKAKELLNIIAKQHCHNNNNRNSKQNRLLFDHIPKCGGTTISNYLLRNYSDLLTFNTFQLSKYYKNATEYFSLLNDDEKKIYHLVYSHGSDILLPYVSQDTIKAVVLRNPVEKIISLYYFNLHRGIISNRVTLHDFIDKSKNEYILRFSSPDERNNFKNTDLVNQCYFNIKKQYDVIGLTEDISSFLSELQNIARLPIPYNEIRNNTTTKRKNTKNITSDLLNLATERLRLDIALYNLVKSDWQNRRGI